jgi:hypothetical protein
MGTWGTPQMPDEYARYLREAKTIKRKEDERSTDDTYATAAMLYGGHTWANAVGQAISASEDSSSSEVSSSTSESGSMD